MSLIIFNHQFPTTCHLLPVLQSMASLYSSWLHLHLDMNKLLKCYSNYWCFITSSYIGVSKFPSLKPLFWHKLPVWLSIRTISPNPGSNAPQRDETFSSTILLFCVAPPAGLLNWKSIQSQSNSHNFSRDCEKYSVLLRRKKNTFRAIFDDFPFRIPYSDNLERPFLSHNPELRPPHSSWVPFWRADWAKQFRIRCLFRCRSFVWFVCRVVSQSLSLAALLDRSNAPNEQHSHRPPPLKPLLSSSLIWYCRGTWHCDQSHSDHDEQNHCNVWNGRTKIILNEKFKLYLITDHKIHNLPHIAIANGKNCDWWKVNCILHGYTRSREYMHQYGTDQRVEEYENY